MIMSDAPISGADGPDPRALLSKGWREEELRWERLAEAAAKACAEDDLKTAQRQWAESLRLAREIFESGDPRLACSLTNHAVCLRQSGQEDLAAKLLKEALLVWDASGPWVEALKPEVRAKSSMYHFRLETRYPGQYDHFSLERYRALAQEGREATKGKRDGGDLTSEGWIAWQEKKPPGFNDLRKLLAAVLLIA